MTKVTYKATGPLNVFNPNGEVSYEAQGCGNDYELLDQACHIFNAPDEILSDEELEIAKKGRSNRLTSMSVGDTVIIEDENGKREYICAPIGWERRV